MLWEGEQMLTVVVVPGPEPLLFGSGSFDPSTTLHLLDDPLDADLPPLLPNYLGDVRQLQELTPYGDGLYP